MLDIALKLVQKLSCGRNAARIVSLSMDEAGVSVILAGEDGQEFVLNLQRLEAAPQAAENPTPLLANDAAPAEEKDHKPAAAIAKSRPADYAVLVNNLYRNVKLEAPAKALLRELISVPLYTGDDHRITDAVRAAAGGDIEPLKLLVRQRIGGAAGPAPPLQ